MGEEMLDLLQQMAGQIGIGLNVAVHRMQLLDRHRQDLLVHAALVLHHQRADRAAANDDAGNDLNRDYDHAIGRVAVVRQRAGDEAIVCGVEHGRVKKAVDEHRAGFLVHFVLHGRAALRDFDHDVDVVRRVLTCRYFGDVH